MEWKKLVVILIGIIFILSVIPGRNYALAEGQGIAILVTDNEADVAVAYSVASITNATVVVCPWGTYDAKVSAKLLSLSPDRVIVIGGPVAVPEDYTNDLKDFGIPYERWYGDTRYETDLTVVEKLSDEFPGLLERVRGVVIANGRDGLALQEYTESVEFGNSGGKLLILTDSGRVDETLKALSAFPNITEVTFLGTLNGTKEMFPLNREWLSDFIRGRFGRAKLDEKESFPGPIETQNILKEVQNRTEMAKTLLDDMKLPDARKRLEKTESLLEMAEDAYKEGNYVRAYSLAMEARWNADFIIARAYRERMTVYQGSAALMLERRISQLQVMASVLKAEGYDVSGVEALIQQALQALKRGDYSDILNYILPQIKRELREKTRTHGKVRGHGNRGRGRRG